MGNVSKYGDFGYKRVVRKKRTIKLDGSKEDDGKWFRCWYCGFINNIDRNSIGDGNGNAYSITVVPTDIAVSGQNAEVVLQIGNTGKTILYDFKPIMNEKHNVHSEAVSGCALCGCKNYR